MKNTVWMGVATRPDGKPHFRLHLQRYFLPWLASLALVICIGVPARAADEAPVDAGIASMEAELAAVEARRAEIVALEAQVAAAEDFSKDILQVRLARAWGQLLEDSLTFTEDVVNQKEAGTDVGEFNETAVEILEGQEAVAQKAIETAQWNSLA